VAFLTVLPLQKRFDKKNLVVGCSVAVMVVTMIPVTLRLLDLAPANGTVELVVLLVTSAMINTYFFMIAFIMFASMVADTLDVQEYRTGLRQEGLFNSVIAFSSKATTGAGILVAGLIIDFAVGLPEGAERSAVTPSMVLRIGIFDAYIVPLFNGVWLWLILKYSITRAQHEDIRDKLSALRSQQAH
jgi:GPH family glycoside/pentoside/hexuronide:cation symporter